MNISKFGAVIKLLTTGRSLEAKMKLVLFMQRFYIYLTEDLEKHAIKEGQLHTLQALRTIVNERMEK